MWSVLKGFMQTINVPNCRKQRWHLMKQKLRSYISITSLTFLYLFFQTSDIVKTNSVVLYIFRWTKLSCTYWDEQSCIVHNYINRVVLYILRYTALYCTYLDEQRCTVDVKINSVVLYIFKQHCTVHI